ncbi:DUF4911 domain-containing protein [bacterium]|nr:MAG: DUF4911 domain-containing protein [bacterium]
MPGVFLYTLAVTTRYFKVDRSEIGYLRFIIESYEGLATISTMDAKNGIVSLSVPDSFAEEADRLVEALRSEMVITEIPFPGSLPDPAERPEN